MKAELKEVKKSMRKKQGNIRLIQNKLIRKFQRQTEPHLLSTVSKVTKKSLEPGRVKVRLSTNI